MSKRAVDFAFNKFPFRYDAHGDVIDFEQTVVLQCACRIGYMQAEKDIIERAVIWLEEHADEYNLSESAFDHIEKEMITDFRKAMEGEQ